MPSLAWTLTQKASTQASEKLMQLSLKTGRLRARGLEVWAVESDNLDFRPHIWKKIAEAKGNGPIVFRVSKELNTAYLAQAKFVVNRRGFVLSRPATIIKKE